MWWSAQAREMGPYFGRQDRDRDAAPCCPPPGLIWGQRVPAQRGKARGIKAKVQGIHTSLSSVPSPVLLAARGAPLSLEGLLLPRQAVQQERLLGAWKMARYF